MSSIAIYPHNVIATVQLSYYLSGETSTYTIENHIEWPTAIPTRYAAVIPSGQRIICASLRESKDMLTTARHHCAATMHFRRID